MEAKASAKPSVLNHSKLAFCSSMRLGTSRTCGIFANVYRSRFGPGSGGCSMVNAPVGIGKVLGCTVPAPFVCAAAAAARFDLLFVPTELFVGDLGAVVFAITRFLSHPGMKVSSRRRSTRKRTREPLIARCRCGRGTRSSFIYVP